METKAYEGWAVVELMGHRRLAGRVSEVQQYGVTMLRIDVPKKNEVGSWLATQFHGGGAIYSVTPCEEPEARRVESHSQPDPTLLMLAAESEYEEMEDDEWPDR